MAEKSKIIIKKYPNRRLYNTQSSSYITTNDVKELVKGQEDFMVQDSKTGEDLTRSVLTQIIFEMETDKASELLSNKFLKQLIAFYDNDLGKFFTKYMEESMEYFTNNHKQIQEMTKNTSFNGANKIFEDISKKNNEVIENSFNFWGNFFPSFSQNNENK